MRQATTPRSIISRSVDTPENKAFVERYKAKYGANQVTNAVMEAAYFQTYLLAQAIEKVGNTDTDALIYRRTSRPGVQGAAGAGQDRREEPPHLAVGAHRQGP